MGVDVPVVQIGLGWRPISAADVRSGRLIGTVTFQRRFRFGRGTEGRASVWAHPNRTRSCEPLGDGRDGARHPRPGVRAVLRPRGIGKAGERLAPPKSLKLLAG